MPERRHKTLTGETGATFSDCERYRYKLWRTWSDGPWLNFVMLNPSTADERTNDPTVERCQVRATKLGYGSLIVTNLFAWRSTNPKALKPLGQSAIGTENDAVIRKVAEMASMVICGWGNGGKLFGRSTQVVAMLRKHCPDKLHCLKLSGEGQPVHPLYQPYDLQPVRLGGLAACSVYAGG